MPRDAHFKQQRCADSDGFSLHAAVRCGADDRQALEQLRRYITRPPCRPHRARGQTPRKSQTVHCTLRVRARLLKRVFEIDMQHCPNCGGRLKIFAVTLQAPVIEKILTQLGIAGLRDLWK
jgi:hypothetical protein